MKSPHKHHIIPRYHCEELGINPDFDDNFVTIERIEHAQIHWEYYNGGYETLLKYIKPKPYVLMNIPFGDKRDVGAAVITAKGELDEIDMSGENNPQWKGGVTNDKEYQKKMIKLWRANNKEHIKAYQKKYEQNPHVKEIRKRSEKNRVRPPEYEKWHKEYMKSPEHKAYQKEYDKKRNQTPERKAANKRRSAAYRARKKAERQGEGTLKEFLK